MNFKVGSAPIPLRKAASETTEVKRQLPPNTSLGEGTIVDSLWLEVDFGPEDDQKGFVLKSGCVESGGERVKVARRGVVQKSVLTEVQFNDSDLIAPWYVLADFLVARAIIETGITNADPQIPDSDGVGPMQVSTLEWKAFSQNGGDLAAGLAGSDREDPIFQISAAAFRMHSDLKAISDLRTPAGQGTKSDPFIPQLLDVFFAYLTDSPAAALAIRDAFESSANLSQPVTKFLRGPLEDAEVTAVLKVRSKFFGTEASPKTLDDVVKQTETALDDALKKAFDDIKQFIPEAARVVSVPERGGGGTTFTAKALVIMPDLIKDFALKDFQAAGILGNFGRETGGFTLFQERHPRSGRGGIGWAQWTGSRRVDFEKFCSDNALDLKSDMANYAFLKHEMQNTSEKKVVPRLKAATSLAEATETFMKVYERPGVRALPERITWAQRALNAFTGVGVSGTTGGGGSGTVARKLKEQIAAGKIIFDSPALESQLLGLNTGTKVTEKLQSLVLKLSELASPKIRISSLVRSGTGSHHTEGRAVDIGNEEIAGALLPQVATDAVVAALEIDELIFDANIAGQSDRHKWNYDQGKKHKYDTATLDAHGNHMHFAVKA